VAGVALHRLDEVGDQVVAPVELDVHLPPRLFDEVPRPHQVVVATDPVEDDADDQKDQQDEDHPERGHVNLHDCPGPMPEDSPSLAECADTHEGRER